MSVHTGATSWRLPSWNGSALYRFSRHSVVTSDSAKEPELALDAGGEESFAHRTTSRGSFFTISSQPSAATVSGSLVSGQLVLEKNPAAAVSCDPAKSQLRADLADLSTPAPALLTPQMSWSDSLSSDVCVGGMTGIANSKRQFTVLGDTTTSEGAAVILLRRDTTALAAEGIVDQHPTVVTGTAETRARIYMIEASGRIWRVTKEQQLRLSISAENRTRIFAQRTTSTNELVR